jgi:hypothetical protein
MTVPGRPRYSRLAMNGLQRAGAFVVQFRTGSDFTGGRVAGRIEHIASGWAACFESSDELLALLERGLKEHALETRRTDHDPAAQSDS